MTVEVPAPAAGVLSEVSVQDGETVEVGALLGAIAEGETAAAAPAPAPAKAAAAPAPEPAPEPEPAVVAASDQPLSPAVRKLVEENNVDTSAITGTGKDGRLLKGDVLAALEKGTDGACGSRVCPGPGAGPRALGSR